MICQRYVSPREYSEIVGWSIATVRRRIADGSLAVSQPGGPRTAVVIDVDASLRDRAAVGGNLDPSHPTPSRNEPASIDLPEPSSPPDEIHENELGESMSRKRKSEKIICTHFTWLLTQRNGVYQADGRSASPQIGRYTLGAKNHEEALSKLSRLDKEKAVERGIASPSILQEASDDFLDLDEGVKLYLDHCRRPRVTKGVAPKSVARYRAVFNKAVPFFKKEGLRAWNQVNRCHLESYAAWLDGEGYAYRTEFLELVTIKQAVNFWIDEGHLPAESRVRLPMEKLTDTDTYCYRPEEVAAMVALCRREAGLDWLGNVIIGLSATGMRISELSALRWSNVSFEDNVITLIDETRSRRRRSRDVQSLKNRRRRVFPIHPELRTVLELLHRKNAQGRVFRGPKGEVLRPDQVRIALVKRVLTPLNGRFPSPEDEVGFKDGRLHSFRHFFCSRAANSGVPEQAVMLWLGHRQSDMVKRYYHLFDEEAQRQMEKLNFIGGSDVS